MATSNILKSFDLIKFSFNTNTIPGNKFKPVLFLSCSRCMHINAVLCVGKGYNILNDNLTSSAIFKMDDASLMETPFGVKIPAGMHMRKVNLQFAFFSYLSLNHHKQPGILFLKPLTLQFTHYLFHFNHLKR